MSIIAYDFLDIEEDYKIIERDTEDVLLSLHNLNTYIGKTVEISNSMDKIDNESDMEKARLSTLIENDLEDIGMLDLDLADIEEAKESFASRSIETVKKFFAMIWKKIKELISKMTGNTKKIDKVVEKVAKKVKEKVKEGDIKVRDLYDTNDALTTSFRLFMSKSMGYIVAKNITTYYDVVNHMINDYDVTNGIDLPEGLSKLNRVDGDDIINLNEKFGLFLVEGNTVDYFYLDGDVKTSSYRTRVTAEKPFDTDLPTSDEDYEQYTDRMTKEFKKTLKRLEDFIPQTKKESDRLLHLKPFEVDEDNPNNITVMRLGKRISVGLMDNNEKFRLTGTHLSHLEFIESERISKLTSLLASFSKVHKDNLSRLSISLMSRIDDLNAE